MVEEMIFKYFSLDFSSFFLRQTQITSEITNGNHFKLVHHYYVHSTHTRPNTKSESSNNILGFCKRFSHIFGIFRLGREVKSIVKLSAIKNFIFIFFKEINVVLKHSTSFVNVKYVKNMTTARKPINRTTSIASKDIYFQPGVVLRSPLYVMECQHFEN